MNTIRFLQGCALASTLLSTLAMADTTLASLSTPGYDTLPSFETSVTPSATTSSKPASAKGVNTKTRRSLASARQASSALRMAEKDIANDGTVNYKTLIKNEAMKNYKGQLVLVIGNNGARVLGIVHSPTERNKPLTN